MIALLRLSLAVIVFLASLLAVFPEPTYNLWKLAIAVTEWGWVLALIALIPLLPGWSSTKTGRIAAALSVIAIVLSLSPLVRAVPIARDLAARLDYAFGCGVPGLDSTEGNAPSSRPVGSIACIMSMRSETGATLRPAPLVFTDVIRGVRSPSVSVSTHTYVVRDGKPLELDMYRSAPPAANAPLVVMIHGGSWHGGGRGALSPLNRYLAARGYAVAAVSYRLAPEHLHPAASEDVAAAIAYLKSNAARHGVDSSRIVLIGRSAGGQLALLGAYTVNDPAIRGVVSLYGPSDQKYGYDHPSKPRVLDSRGILEGFLGGTPATVPAAYGLSSPINYVGSHTIPTLLIHGARDELVFPAQSEMLAARLAAAGRPHFFLELPWGRHGCDFNFSGPCGQLSTFAIERFLAAVMK
ncbi:MAG: alpha/beta hydrolase [Gemmatimonadaceae bacterium]